MEDQKQTISDFLAGTYQDINREEDLFGEFQPMTVTYEEVIQKKIVSKMLKITSKRTYTHYVLH